MRLHAIYRSIEAENTKPRPPGYSKLSCLHSFLRARAACPEPGETLFLNSGPIPADQVELMLAGGELVARGKLELHESYWEAIGLALSRGWPDDDLVYFAEDDYLYRREAFEDVAEAARRLPAAGYLAPYGTVGDRMPNGRPLHPGLRRPGIPATRLAEAGGVSWHRGVSHTSSFAARVGVLRGDRRLHDIAPRCGGAWDHSLALAYQGRLPYTVRGLAEPLRATGAPASRRAKAVVWRAALTALAPAARRRRRVLAIPQPALTTHMETELLATGTEWASELEAADMTGDARG